MAEYSYEDYLKNRESRTSTTSVKSNVGYFKLADDGDEALVRFDYASPSELNLAHIHIVNYNGTYRRVMCLRERFDSVDKCPLCAKGEKLSSKVYIKLIEYSKDEAGNITSTPKVWERPESFATTIAHYIEDYGDLRDCVFKIRRIGKKGDTKTTYDIAYQNPMKYTEELGFKKDFKDFENFDLSHHSYVKRTAEDLKIFLETGELFPKRQQNDTTQVAPRQTLDNTPLATTRPVSTTQGVREPVSSVSQSPVESEVRQQEHSDTQPTRARRTWNY